jgi:hypothetical protein
MYAIIMKKTTARKNAGVNTYLVELEPPRKNVSLSSR